MCQEAGLPVPALARLEADEHAAAVAADDAAPEALSLLEVAARPGVMATAQVERDGYAETVVLSATPTVAVELTAVAPDRYQLRKLPVDRYLPWLLELASLGYRPPASVQPFEVGLRRFAWCCTEAARGRTGTAVDGLVGDGVSEEGAVAFAAAVSERVRSVDVELLHRPTVSRLAGVEVSWVDGGVHGVWSSSVPVVGFLRTRPDQPTSDPSAVVTVGPAPSVAVAGELAAALPGAASPS